MKAKYIIAIAILGMAFCVLALTPAEETDAADYGADELDHVNVGTSRNMGHTYSGGRWNDQIKVAPTVTDKSSNVSVAGLRASNFGEAYNWYWVVSLTIFFDAPGPFWVDVYFQTTGGFLTADDEYFYSVSGTAYEPVTYTFTLNYNANGGSGAPSAQTGSKEMPTSYTFTIPSTTPTRANYTFLGWAESSSATSPTKQPGDYMVVHYDDNPKTLYAVWQSITYYSYYLYYNANGGSGAPSTQSYSSTSSSSHSFAIPSTTPTRANYTFLGWSTSSSATAPSYYPGGSISVSANSSKTLYAVWKLNEVTVSFVASPNYGSFQPVNSVTVPYGSQIYIDGSTLSINDIDVTAVANASDGDYTYSFDSWSVSSGQTITQNTTVTANFSRSAISHITHWSNGMMNGRVSMVFDWTSEQMEIHNMSMALYSGYVGADYVTVWNNVGYVLNMSLSYPNTNFAFDLQNNGASVLSKTVTAGKWDKYELTIDAENGQVWMTPLKTFTSFMEYTTLDSQKTLLLDFSSFVLGTAISIIDHEDTGTGDHVRFSVTNTDVFLNTYGIVMSNPSINIYNYFPQYEKVRVNFYAFAIYGNAFTINGTTFNVENGQVTVRYAQNGNGDKFLPSLLPDEEVKERTFALNNIYVTWDGTDVSLTFQSDRFTINLGQYSQNSETISFTGIWYFTSTIYEPQTSYEKQLGEWKVLPDLDMNQMLLIFLGILALVGSVAWIKLGGGIIDAMVMVFAGITAFILLV